MASGIVKWRAKQVAEQTADTVEKQLLPAARIIEKHIKRKFKQRTFGTGTGELFASIDTKKSRFKHGGYIIGVFGQPTARWEDSLGARAIFFEFGRAAPGHARSKVKAQPPRPFMRTGLRAAKSEIRRKLKLRAR
jgi:hypothetical protein